MTTIAFGFGKPAQAKNRTLYMIHQITAYKCISLKYKTKFDDGDNNSNNNNDDNNKINKYDCFPGKRNRLYKFS